jgi:uncharacterized membrane protein YoaK (UPF0700 family)
MSTVPKQWMPRFQDPYGPLPLLLHVMTFVTGLVDAFAYLVLGHVFVANMTGNVVFVGFALAGAPGFSIVASLAAIAAFMVGAVAGGEVSSILKDHRGRLLFTSTVIQSVFFAAAVALAAPINGVASSGTRYSLIACLGIAMGLQTAVVRRIAVPDMTTTVLTMTLAGIASDHVALGGPGWKFGRRFSAIASMFLGGLVGAVLVLHVSDVDPLIIALVATMLVALATAMLGRHGQTWTKPSGTNG